MLGKTIAAAATALLLLTAAAAAQSAPEPTRIQQFDAWGAYSYASPTGKVCYVLSVPIKSEPAGVTHGDIFFLISQNPAQNLVLQPQAMMGYPLKPGSKVEVTVDKRSFSFFTSGDGAWVENAAEEPQLIAAMRAGTAMSIKAVSRRGTNTSYEYSLKGVTAALSKINDCK